jgi:hypothetical protein
VVKEPTVNGGSRRRAPAHAGTPLDGLLAEVRELRLTLAADLNAAAGAAEAGAESVAADIVEADRAELARFARVADARLTRLDRQREAAPSWRRRVAVALPVVPVVGALALSAAAATGALPIGGTTKPHTVQAAAAGAAPVLPVSSSFRQFMHVLNSDPNASEVIAAASRLHNQIAHLIASAPGPNKAAQIAQLIALEQSIVEREQPPGAATVLNATRRLAAKLISTIDRTGVRVTPTATPLLVTTTKSGGHHKSRTKTTTSPSPSKSPTPSKSPKPSPSSSPSPTKSPGGPPLPGLPNQQPH